MKFLLPYFSVVAALFLVAILVQVSSADDDDNDDAQGMSENYLIAKVLTPCTSNDFCYEGTSRGLSCKVPNQLAFLGALTALNNSDITKICMPTLASSARVFDVIRKRVVRLFDKYDPVPEEAEEIIAQFQDKAFGPCKNTDFCNDGLELIHENLLDCRENLCQLNVESYTMWSIGARYYFGTRT